MNRMRQVSNATLPQTAQTHSSTPTRIWFILSLAIALLYRLPAFGAAFALPYLVQDDARQHVFWMQRFANPDLFPDDLLADYFQSVAPWGYTHLYKAAAFLGIDVWVANKTLPLMLGLVVTAYLFGIVLKIVPVPVAGFVAVLLLNQTLIERDDLVSATPVAFFYPFFAAFLYYLLKQAVIPCAAAIVLMGLFYPQGVLVMAVMLGLRLGRWSKGRLGLSRSRLDYWLWGVGWVAAFWVLLPYALHDSPYGPVLTAEQAQTMFALSPRGWSDFYSNDPIDFWFFGRRTGLLPMEWQEWDLKTFPQVWLTLSIPFLLLLRQRSQRAQTMMPRLSILLQVAIASTLCFGAAHLLLFELHLPNRYTEHSFRILMAIGGGVAIALMQVPLYRRFRVLKGGLLALLMAAAIAPFFVYGFTPDKSRIFGRYIYGAYPQIYEYLQAQPEDSQVASIAAEINLIPSFTQRSILVGGKGFAVPYHLGYFNEVERRAIALVEAQYSLDPAVVRAFLTAYPIDFWLIDDAMFTIDWVIFESEWLEQYARDTRAPLTALLSGQPTVIETLADTCLVRRDKNLRVISADCLRRELAP